MEITKELLIDAIIGKGFIGNAKHRSMEVQLFSELGIVFWNGEPFKSKPKFSRLQLGRLELQDLQTLYTRKYEKEVNQKIILASVIPQQPQRFN